MDFGTLFFLGFLWFLFNLLRKGGTGTDGSAPPKPKPIPTARKRLPQDLAKDRVATVQTNADATQREGSRLEALLRDLNRTLEDAAQAKTEAERRTEEEFEDGDVFEEERESLEVEPEVVSVETAPSRPRRVIVDQDDQASATVARRIKEAEARSAAQTPADHRKFDERIRREPADRTAVAVAAVSTYTPDQLKNAVVWRELLGPPIALRDEEQRRY